MGVHDQPRARPSYAGLGGRALEAIHSPPPRLDPVAVDVRMWPLCLADLLATMTHTVRSTRPTADRSSPGSISTSHAIQHYGRNASRWVTRASGWGQKPQLAGPYFKMNGGQMHCFRCARRDLTPLLRRLPTASQRSGLHSGGPREASRPPKRTNEKDPVKKQRGLSRWCARRDLNPRPIDP